MTTTRRALVTGTSGDIGSAIARRLAADGLQVLCHAGSNLDKAEAIAAGITAAGGAAPPLPAGRTARRGGTPRRHWR